MQLNCPLAAHHISPPTKQRGNLNAGCIKNAHGIGNMAPSSATGYGCHMSEQVGKQAGRSSRIGI
jgi:hypothetical protein